MVRPHSRCVCAPTILRADQRLSKSHLPPVRQSCWKAPEADWAAWQLAAGSGLPLLEQGNQVVYRVRRQNPRAHNPLPGCMLSSCCGYSVEGITAWTEMPSTTVITSCNSPKTASYVGLGSQVRLEDVRWVCIHTCYMRLRKHQWSIPMNEGAALKILGTKNLHHQYAAPGKDHI